MIKSCALKWLYSERNLFSKRACICVFASASSSNSSDSRGYFREYTRFSPPESYFRTFEFPFKMRARRIFFVFFSPSNATEWKFFIIRQARNKEQEQEVLEWIEAVIGEKLPAGNYEDILKDGVVLCQLINKLAPGSVKKIQTKGTNFQLMENIQRCDILAVLTYILSRVQSRGARLFNVPLVTDSKLPSRSTACQKRKSSRPLISSRGGTLSRWPCACTPSAESLVYELYTATFLSLFCQLAHCFVYLQTQKHPEYNGPRLGPKMADENKREFTEEQLRANEGHLNLQMGFNKGASQSGHGGFGNTRHMWTFFLSPREENYRRLVYSVYLDIY